tara:strand:+ start:140 stop:340 length:201 start_codon:yes stop_codon:yes gene_type:complete
VAYSLPVQLMLTDELSKVELSVLMVVMGEFSAEESPSKSSTLISSQDRKIIIKSKEKLYFNSNDYC